MNLAFGHPLLTGGTSHWDCEAFQRSCLQPVARGYSPQCSPLQPAPNRTDPAGPSQQDNTPPLVAEEQNNLDLS